MNREWCYTDRKYTQLEDRKDVILMERKREWKAVAPCHHQAILELNAELVHFLAPMDQAGLEKLLQESNLFHVVEIDGQMAAFVIALTEDTAYGNENYLWFQSNVEKFLYVDRIVINPAFQRMGIGVFIYDHIFAQAKAIGAPCVTAEIDIAPPNPVSLAFHKRFGFVEIGTKSVYNGKKMVSLQSAVVE